MPPRRAAARKGKKGRGKGRKSNIAPETRSFDVRLGPQMPTGIPDRLINELIYDDMHQIAPGAPILGEYIYNLNSLFDPDRTGVGHQPRYFDRMAALYKNYRVLSVEVDCWASSRFFTPSTSTVVNLVPAASSAVLTGDIFPGELPRAVRVGLAQPGQTVHVRTKFVPAAILGRPMAEYMADDPYAALVTASPAKIATLHVHGVSADQASACNFEFAIRLRFRAEFYERQDEGDSVEDLPPVAMSAAQAAAASVVVSEAESDDVTVATLLAARDRHAAQRAVALRAEAAHLEAARAPFQSPAPAVHRK